MAQQLRGFDCGRSDASGARRNDAVERGHRCARVRPGTKRILSVKSNGRTGDALSVTKVVVIDDDETIAEVLAAFLTSGGFQVRVANSATTGILLVNETIPDAVVCDMRMPGRGGDAVITALKNEPRTSHIPVVLVTGFCTPEVLGIADALMLKPVRCVELISTVRHLAA